ncbi:response regulator [Phyllobacterium sp. UNC302MFCol5.2]|uniref:response regulator n=1 Tax=Phyllobacterium sp. UNC302MFCol5.2 TaxID=1449065 RepID=UPI0004806CD0|nr:response regulator [Phyllobacterium sp. UNC302MFCol5.2]
MEMTGMRILVLEDEYLIGLDLERIAEECGAQSVQLIATVGELQAQIANETDYDLAILEVQARGVSSLDSAAEMQRRGLPIVFTTAYDSQANGVPGFPDIPVVAKPYGKAQILQAVAKALANSQHNPASRRNGASGEFV